MKFSFIITSLGNAGQLQNCVDSIEKADRPGRGTETEILVVFQGVKEGGCDIKVSNPASCCFYYTDGRGLSSARNYAIGKSKGDLLIFLDDDAEVREDFLRVLAGHCSEPGADAFCGKIMAHGTDNAYSLCFNDNRIRNLGRTDFRYFMGSSHVLKKSAIDKIGLYDERFGAGAKYKGAEETDLFFRLKKKGARIVYVPQLVYYHPLIYSFKSVDYSYAMGAVLTKQIFSDKKHIFVYLGLIIGTLLKTFLRVSQHVFFPKSIMLKNSRFRYRLMLSGTVKGMLDYSKDNFGKCARPGN